MMEFQHRPLAVGNHWKGRGVVTWTCRCFAESNDQEWSPVVRCVELLAGTQTTGNGYLCPVLSYSPGPNNWARLPWLHGGLSRLLPQQPKRGKLLS
ncbi:MAG TPA: hypothetical protein VF043_12110 [Ktedonobacteraceae bacterium]